MYIYSYYIYSAKSTKYTRTQSHSTWHSVQQCLQASQVICRRGVVSSHTVRRHYDTARTSRRTATLRPHSTTGQTIHVVLCNAVVVPRSHSCVRVCCCYPRPDRWCSPQRDEHPTLSPFSQTIGKLWETFDRKITDLGRVPAEERTWKRPLILCNCL